MAKKTSEYEKIWRDMQRALSAPRIAPYTTVSDEDEIDSLGRYYWNMALCEAFYPVLHSLEVALRNSMHSALTTGKGTALWYDLAGLLGPYEQNRVIEAKAELTKQGKPLDHDRVVAELTFGFWTGLLSRYYDRQIAIPVLPRVFAHAPARLRTRRVIHPILEDIRFVRNRIFHHEPIWYWHDLPAQHQQVLDIIGWISPSTKMLLGTVDRFSVIYGRGWKHYRDEIKFRLLEEEEARTASKPKT